MSRTLRSVACCRVAGSLIVIGVSLTATNAIGQPVVFVNSALATGANDGSSWENAYQGAQGLQSGLAAATLGSGTQIWVAAGRYTPAAAGGSRTISFSLKSGVELYGGFAGSETSLDQRNPVLHPTILSGDLNGNDTSNFGNRSDNSRHVVRGTNVDAAAVIDGFTIRDGDTDTVIGLAEGRGANLLLENSHPSIRNCVVTAGDGPYGAGAALVGSSPALEDCRFTANRTSSQGGGLANFDGGSPTLTRCRFDANIGGSATGIFSGPFFLNGQIGGLLRVIDCDFIDNTGSIGAASGIGMLVDRSPAHVVRSRFVNNTTDAGGAGMFLANTASMVVACDFVRNDAPGDGGGAIYVDGDSAAQPNVTLISDCRFVGNNGAIFANANGQAEMVNCTIANNNLGSGFLAWPAVGSHGRIKLKNCIVWGNRPAQGAGLAAVLGGGGEITADACDVQSWDGSRPGTGTFAADPMFADSAGIDGIAGTNDDDVHVKAGSPCVDAGSDGLLPVDSLDLDHDGDSNEPLSLDLDDRTRVTICRVEIGAYERPGGRPRSGDLTGDGTTGLADVAPFVAALLNPAVDCVADTDGSGGIDGRDIAGFVGCVVGGCS